MLDDLFPTHLRSRSELFLDFFTAFRDILGSGELLLKLLLHRRGLLTIAIQIIVQELVRIIDLDHAAFRSHRLDHVIRHVSWVPRYCAAGRMRSYEWRAADRESSPKCRISDVRNIDHHSKTIQFTYDVFSKIIQAVVFRGADVRIRPIRV